MAPPNDETQTTGEPEGKTSSFRVKIAVLIGVLFVASALGRLFVGDRASAEIPASGAPAGADSFVIQPGGGVPPILGGGGTQEPEPASGEAAWTEPVAKSLPYVTEGSFFALIGFALGYLSRKLVKVGLIVLAVAFLFVQGLSYLGVATLDWTRAVELVNQFVLNLKENQTLGEIVKDRVPTAGALVAGYALGFRRS